MAHEEEIKQKQLHNDKISEIIEETKEEAVETEEVKVEETSNVFKDTFSALKSLAFFKKNLELIEWTFYGLKFIFFFGLSLITKKKYKQLDDNNVVDIVTSLFVVIFVVIVFCIPFVENIKQSAQQNNTIITVDQLKIQEKELALKDKALDLDKYKFEQTLALEKYQLDQRLQFEKYKFDKELEFKYVEQLSQKDISLVSMFLDKKTIKFKDPK